jgi:hypothetical protein
MQRLAVHCTELLLHRSVIVYRIAVQNGAPKRRETADDSCVCIAPQTTTTVRSTGVGIDIDRWGIDHGTWSVLQLMFPAADIPVMQLSIDATKDLDSQFRRCR